MPSMMLLTLLFIFGLCTIGQGKKMHHYLRTLFRCRFSFDLAYRIGHRKNEPTVSIMEQLENESFDDLNPEQNIIIPCYPTASHLLCQYPMETLSRRDTGFLRFGRK
jgi:hypothetical protein